MTATLLAALFALAAEGGPSFVESRIAFDAEISGYDCVDVDGDGHADVLVITHSADARRLELFLQKPGERFDATPDFVLRPPEDVVAYAFLDVRPEPGKELLLFSRDGVLSVSTTKQDLRGNAEPLLRQPFFPEITEPDEVLRWPWIFDVDGDGADDLLMPESGGLAIWKPSKSADGRVEFTKGNLIAIHSEEEAPVERAGALDVDLEFGEGARTLAPDHRAFALFPGAGSSLPRGSDDALFRRGERRHLPHYTDWNGDKRWDAVSHDRRAIEVRMQRADGSFAPEVDFPFAQEIGKEKDLDVQVIDLDGDEKPELVRIEGDANGTQKVYEVTAYDIAPGGAPAEKPRCALVFKASSITFALRDVDRDGRMDLVLRIVDLPIGLATLSSVRVDTALEVYLGQKDGTFASRPSARFERSLKPEQLERLNEALLFHLSGDYDGDGLDDALFLGEDGTLRLYPLKRNGDGIEFDETPAGAPYRPSEPLRSAWAHELSGDQTSDLVLRFERQLILLVSRPGGSK